MAARLFIAAATLFLLSEPAIRSFINQVHAPRSSDSSTPEPPIQRPHKSSFRDAPDLPFRYRVPYGETENKIGRIKQLVRVPEPPPGPEIVREGSPAQNASGPAIPPLQTTEHHHFPSSGPGRIRRR